VTAPPSFSARLRRRLAIAFVLVAGLAAGALSVGALAVTQSYRSDQFVERARINVERDLRALAAGAPSSISAARLADREQAGGPGVIVRQGADVIRSIRTLDLHDVPDSVVDGARAEPGRIVEGRADIVAGPALVLGTVDRTTGAELYYFFPRTELERSIRDLRTTLVLGWLAVVAIAAVVGTLIARRTLRPVRDAAIAANAVTEGLLDTRLPIRGDDEFGEWATAFNDMVSALESKIGALGESRDRERRFTADVAHDLRTPLGAVLTAASHLKTRVGDLPPDAVEMVDIVVSASRRLDRLTREYLELHRLESGDHQLRVEEVQLHDAVEACMRAHGWTDRIVLRPGIDVVVETDPHWLDRILVNLIANAVQHGGANVTVDVEDHRSDVVVSISDDGPGIPPDALPHLFERHFRGRADRTPTAEHDAIGGSGLGLSIADEAARLLGGRIEVDSGETGATFRVVLPRRAEAMVGPD
jgi:two-component system sensor histidine kinase MtrB